MIPKEIAEKVSFINTLPQSDLLASYQKASIFIFPSEWHEPFGMPNIEAMACGVPVVAARRAAIPEVCGDAAILVEPHVEGLAEGAEAVLEQRSSWVERGLERASQFSWKATAEKTRGIYQELLG